MATERFHLCTKCNQKLWTHSLFDALFAVTTGKMHVCPKCCGSCELHLSFKFGLEATGGQCIVVDAFLPDEPVQWANEAGQVVIFYPFLVITDGEGGRGAWLPYWHVVQSASSEAKKYGQWAPFMDLSTFEELVTKARAKGYLR